MSIKAGSNSQRIHFFRLLWPLLGMWILSLRPVTISAFFLSFLPTRHMTYNHNNKYSQEPLSFLQLSSSTDINNESSKSTSPKASNKPKGKRRQRTRPRTNKSKSKASILDPNELTVWRLYGITTHPDDDEWYQQLADRDHAKRQKQLDEHNHDHDAPIPPALLAALQRKLKLDPDDSDKTNTAILDSVSIVRRSVDARKKLDHPNFSYVVDVTVTNGQAKISGLKHQPGRSERISKEAKILPPQASVTTEFENPSSSPSNSKTVVVVGAGPAGLFCALQLALSSSSNVKVILLDRGQPVEVRGRDIGALIHRRQLNEESNFAFGEGGAGTWSDGKLTTRIGRNSQNVRWILETFVKYGAPSNILWEGAPHLGTDNLVRLLRNMRLDLMEGLGASVEFGARVTNLILDPKDPSRVQGVEVEYTESTKGSADESPLLASRKDTIMADAVVLATGHSARDVYESLAAAAQATGNGDGCLEPKGFAVGFRIEHPQRLITEIQYGPEWGPTVNTGTGKTDLANQQHFDRLAGTSDEFPEKARHTGRLPVPSYRLATDKANDGLGGERGVYSFCMCPGGQIVPSSTNSSEVCVNGMSFSKRNSEWANSALVVTVAPDDAVLEPYRKTHGVLAGLAFQRDMEHRAAIMGGGKNLTVPVQRVTDFLHGTISETLPSSSYRLGVKSAPCHEIYPEPITAALRDALQNYFNASMPGYVHPDGLLHAVETRTSSPLRMARDRSSMLARGMQNLFPAGEGAGFAGGIVSAAVDGRIVAEAVLDDLLGMDRENRLQGAEADGVTKSIGFNY